MLTLHAPSLRGPMKDAALPTSRGDSSDPAGFSSLLRQTQAAAVHTPPPATTPRAAAPTRPADTSAQAPAHEPASTTNTTSDHDAEASAETDEAASNDSANRTRAMLKPRLRGNDGAARNPKSASDAAAEAKPADPAPADAVANAATNGAANLPAQVDPHIAQWLAALQRPASAAPNGDGPAATADGTAAALGDASGPGRAPRAADADVGAEPKDKAAHGASRFAAAEAAGLAAAAAEPPRHEATPAPTSHAIAGAGDAASALQQPASASGREAVAPVVVPLATPVNSPDFAQTLGVQLSVFAKEGVQQAELHLNPAEMGPVSVQIVMEGTQARIDFGADVAATRSAIEAGLPELASALRDAGFTLAGGGVSQHSSPRGDGGRSDGGGSQRHARPVADDTVARVSTAARRIVSHGGLDLYA